MNKLKKLFQVLGFWALIISIIPIILFIIAIVFQFIIRLKETPGYFPVAQFISIFICPYISIGFSIGGLIKDKSKTLAIIGLLISVLIILFLVFFLNYGFLNVS